MVTVLSCAVALVVGRVAHATGLPEGMPGEVKDAPLVSPFLKDIGIDQHLNAELPKDAVFTDDSGKQIQLGDLFGQKPAILVMVYYECPQLCNMVLNQMVRTMNGMNALAAGEDFNVIAISIDPGETPEMASKKKRAYMKEYGKRGNPAGWHFLTGTEENIKRVTETVGFRYRYDPKYDEYMHASGIMVATTDGRMSRYFYGVEYDPTDLRMSLGDASQGKIGGVVKVVLDYCLRYDPMTGKYGPDIMNLLRAGGILTVLSLGTFMFVMLRKDRRARLANSTITADTATNDGRQ
jgi:protein SCO1/2